MISIHAPHAGSDDTSAAQSRAPHHFNPRSPCGERRSSEIKGGSYGNFNPRSPCGERQLSWIITKAMADFNPRSPCGERQKLFTQKERGFDFNPRSPCGERHKDDDGNSGTFGISIHAPHAGSDQHGKRQSPDFVYFNPRSPCGERHVTHGLYRALMEFQSTLPMRGATL